jgi:phage terminase small subunit
MIDKLKPFEQWMNTTSEAEKEETRRVFGDLKAFYDQFANALNEVKERERSTGVRLATKSGSKNLTSRESRFIAALLADPAQNATKAAIKAGYSKKTATVQASRLLRKVHIAEMRRSKSEELTAEYDISAKWVLNELAKIARCDPRKFFNKDGSPKDITALDDVSAAGVAGFDVLELFDGSQGDQKHVTGLVKKIKLSDRIRALELLGKHQAAFTDKVKHSGKLTLEDLVCGSYEKEDV